jgi:glycosyltransferase involved in cell wall biosynthesis
MYLRNVVSGVARTIDVEVVGLSAKPSQLPSGVVPKRVLRVAPSRWADREHDLLLPFDLARVDADVVWSPALDPPRRCSTPWVQTLHDVIPLVIDDPALNAERRRWERYRERFARAAAVIAVSEHAAGEGIRVLGLDPARVHVVHHGAEPVFQPAAQPSQLAERPYLLYVGEFDPRKGMAEAFAVASLVAEGGLPHVLHAAGRIAPWYRDNVEALRAATARPERIRLTGFLSPVAEAPETTPPLVAAYQGAAVLCMTTRYEGFGLPALEAMACGTPVVAFSNSSVTEVVGDGGILVRDGDVEAFAREVIRLLTDEAAWNKWSERGRRRASDFSWQRSVDAHVKILRSAAR